MFALRTPPGVRFLPSYAREVPIRGRIQPLSLPFSAMWTTIILVASWPACMATRFPAHPDARFARNAVLAEVSE